MEQNNVMTSEINYDSVHMPEEPDKDDHSPFNSEDESMYVHRSLRVDYVRFDESTM
jgi:hypothetical protein